jgi:LysM repeat protein
MQSLSAHLRSFDEHDHLDMHPACPACRDQRVVGSAAELSGSSQRLQAIVTIGALGLTGFTPASAIAADPDREFEGDKVEQVVNDSTDPDRNIEESGANEAAAPSSGQDEASTSDTAGAATDDDVVGGAPEPEATSEDPIAPETDPDAVDAPVPTNTAANGTPTPPGTTPAATTPPAQADATAPPAAPEAVASAAQANASQPRPHHRRHASQKLETARTYRVSSPPAPPPAPVEPAAPATAPAQVAPPPRPVVTRLVAQKSSGLPSRGDATYTVNPGDSLWSIAKALRGQTAANAEIAREVNRLWNLNADRIATGNPDLLMVGTRLKLR